MSSIETAYFAYGSVALMAGAAWGIFFAAVYLGSSAHAQHKLLLWPYACLHFLFSTDRFWSPQTDATVLLARQVRRKRVYFIRHAESAWNVLFNRGFGFQFFPNLLNAILEEIQMMPTGDSVFLDSPLSSGGISQCLNLKSWIDTSADDQHALFLKNVDPSKVALCTSNLRRSTSTSVIALSGRLLKYKDEHVYVLSAMQELTRNFDGVSLAEAESGPDSSALEKSLPELTAVNERIYKAGKVDGRFNEGTKPLIGSNGLKRFTDFGDWVFNSSAAKEKSSIIATGHSLWLKEMMKAYLPSYSDHRIKKSKIVNCGVVLFDLVDCGSNQYAIDPHSIQMVHGGFEGKSFDMSKLKE